MVDEVQRLRYWLTYFAACEAVTLSIVEERARSSQSDRNRHRGILSKMLQVLDGGDPRRVSSEEFNMKTARRASEAYPASDR